MKGRLYEWVLYLNNTPRNPKTKSKKRRVSLISVLRILVKDSRIKISDKFYVRKNYFLKFNALNATFSIQIFFFWFLNKCPRVLVSIFQKRNGRLYEWGVVIPKMEKNGNVVKLKMEKIES